MVGHEARVGMALIGRSLESGRRRTPTQGKTVHSVAIKAGRLPG